MDVIISNILNLVETGKYDDALKSIENFILDKTDPIDQYVANIVKIDIYKFLGKFDEMEILFKEIEKHNSNINNNQTETHEYKYWTFKNFILKGNYFMHKGDLDSAIKNYSIAKTFDSLGDIELVNARMGLANAYFVKGQLNRAKELFLEVIPIYRNLNKLPNLAACLTNLGSTYRSEGDFDKAKEYYLEGLKIKKQIGNKWGISSSHINFGILLNEIGKYQEALFHLNEGYNIALDMDEVFLMACAKYSIGYNYELKGEIKHARQLYEETLNITEKIDNPQHIAQTRQRLASIDMKLNELDSALSYAKLAFDYHKESNHALYLVETCYQIISIYLMKEDFEKANLYLQKIAKINFEVENEINKQYYILSKALILKKQRRAKDKFKAQDLLYQITNGKIVSHAITIAALENLCDLLISELLAFGDNEVFLEIRKATKKLTEIALKNNLIPVYINTLLLESKLLLLDNDLESVHSQLQEALDHAKSNELKFLINLVEDEIHKFNEKITTWEHMLKSNMSTIQIIKESQIEDFMTYMINHFNN